MAVRFECGDCHRLYSWDEPVWRCRCGGLLTPVLEEAFEPAAVKAAEASLWRYGAWLPPVPPTTLGEGWTPLLPADWQGQRIWFKADHQNPTGSFKDRGAAVQVSRLAALGVREVVEDSSGNAGSALALYAARAGLAAAVYVPEHAPAAKLRMIQAAGARLVSVEGCREAVGAAARAAAATRWYASHVWDPAYLLGTRTIAWEIAEQRGWQAPDKVVAPVGNGSLLLGLALGFQSLLASGVIDRLPRLVGVQAAACAPLATAWAQRGEAPRPVSPQPTLAGGVAVAEPGRGAQILAAVAASGGTLLAVDEPTIAATQAALARRGWYVEPTGALGVAALAQVATAGTVVVILTGHGLKGA